MQTMQAVPLAPHPAIEYNMKDLSGNAETTGKQKSALRLHKYDPKR